MTNIRLGASILDRRRNLNMTQQQLAERVGVHQTRVSHWERGSRVPTADQLQGLAEVFGVDMQTLVADFLIESDVERALLQDPLLPDEAKHALLSLYRVVTRQAVGAG